MRELKDLAVIFDLDGTLVDSIGDLHAIAGALLTENGLAPLPIDTVRGFVGAGIPTLVDRCFAASGRSLDGRRRDNAVARFKDLYACAPARLTRAYDGVPSALKELNTLGIRMGVCTNKAEEISRAVLDAVGLSPFFEAVVGGDTLPVRKPDPAMLAHTASLLGCTPACSIFVGDSEIDAETAQRAGVPLILFAKGYRKEPVEALMHAAVFEEFAALPYLVKSLQHR